MDRIDRSILKELQQDSGQTIKEVADKVGLSTTPVHERIRRMEREGIIKRYTVILDRARIGLPLLAFCNVVLNTHQREYLQEFEENIIHFEEVLACYHLAGSYDYLLKVAVNDMAAYQNFVTQKLASLKNIGKVQSSFVMTQVKEERILPIADLPEASK